jgi:lysophospholipase L1-like esterase
MRLSSSKRNRRLKWLGLVLVLIALDVGVGSLVIPSLQNSHRTLHPYYHHGMLPEMAVRERWGEREYWVYTNSLALKDHSKRRVPLLSERGRVLFMGDSFTEGIGVPYDESFVGLIGAKLAEVGTDVINGGVIHYGPTNYYLKTKFLVEHQNVAVDHVVVLIDISDPLNEVLLDIYFRPPRIEDVNTFWHRVEPKLNTISLTNYFVAKLRSGSIQKRRDALVHPIFPPKKAYSEMPLWTIDERVFEDWGRRGLELCGDKIEKLYDFCKKRSIALSVVVYPHPGQIEAHDIDSRQVKYWRDFCAKRGLHFVDLFPVFMNRALGSPPEIYQRYFIDGDIHWNAAGHRIVAEALLEQLPI